MKPGDILAYEINKDTTNYMSKLISWISRYTVGNWLGINQTSFSHVSILSRVGGYQYESTWPRGGLNYIKWNKYNVYSVKYQELTDEQRERILNYCKDNVNKKYDWLALLTFGLFSLQGKDLCSRFVADAYLAAGIDLRKPNEYLISPNEIAHHPKMTRKIVYKDG